MSREYAITSDPKRRLAVVIGVDGAVKLRKQWLDSLAGWVASEMTVNGDEWDRITAYRATKGA